MKMDVAADKSGLVLSWVYDSIIVGLLALVLYLGLSFTRPLASPDEGRYSEIPREMVECGDYVTPRLNGMPYFYKPPLFYWMQAASIEAFGINRTSLRLMNALVSAFGVWFAYAAGRVLFCRKTGLFAAAVLSTSALYLAMGNIVTMDMSVSVFAAASMLSALVAPRVDGVWRWLWGLGIFAFAGAAVMSKGLIGIFIPSAVIFLYMLAVGWKNFWAQFKLSDIKILIAGVFVFAAIVVPWHVLASVANPSFENAEGILSKNAQGQGFFWYYFVHEHVLRYLDASTSMRYQPFWFFLALAPVGLVPWVVFAPRAVANYISDTGRAFRSKNTGLLYMLVWVVFVVFFFSLSKSKLAPYILPIYPALAIFVGWWLSRWWAGLSNPKIESWIMVALGYVGAAALPFVYLILDSKGKIIDHSSAICAMSACALVLLVGSSVSCFFLLRKRRRAFIISMAASIFCFSMCFNPMGTIFQRPSAERMVKKILPQLGPDDALVVYTDYGIYQDLPVWAGRLPHCVGIPPTEQRFGFMREKELHEHRFINGDSGFVDFAKKHAGDIYIFTRRDRVDGILKLNPSAAEIDSEGVMVLLKMAGGANATR